jgi:uncharacterized membrane protein YtjA (UPF0391 family)
MLNWALTFFVIALIAAVLGLQRCRRHVGEHRAVLAVLGVIVLVVGLIAATSGRPTLP